MFPPLSPPQSFDLGKRRANSGFELPKLELSHPGRIQLVTESHETPHRRRLV